MKIVKPSYEIMDMKDPKEIMLFLEKCARLCYKSEGNICEGSDEKLIRQLIERGHEAMIEHEKITIKFICNRGVSHELVRHRIASFAQESTRYCNYSKDGFGSEITIIEPSWLAEKRANLPFSTDVEQEWLEAMRDSEDHYMYLLHNGLSAQEARGVLPNDLKTEIIFTMDLRELRHFCLLRAAKTAHPDMSQLAYPLLVELKSKLPILFNDIFTKVEKSYGRVA